MVALKYSVAQTFSCYILLCSARKIRTLDFVPALPRQDLHNRAFLLQISRPTKIACKGVWLFDRKENQFVLCGSIKHKIMEGNTGNYTHDVMRPITIAKWGGGRPNFGLVWYGSLTPANYSHVKMLLHIWLPLRWCNSDTWSIYYVYLEDHSSNMVRLSIKFA